MFICINKDVRPHLHLFCAHLLNFICVCRLLGLRRLLLPMQKLRVPSLGREDSLEEGMATHSSILDWRIPWTEEAGGLQSMGLQGVRND